jgi:hypothetical protein
MMDSWAATLACLLIVASKTSENEGFGVPRFMIGEVVVDMERVGKSMGKSRLCNWVGYRAGSPFVGSLALFSSSSSPKASPSRSYMWRSRSSLTWQRFRDVKRYGRESFFKPGGPYTTNRHTQAFHSEGLDVDQDWLEPNSSEEEQQ